MWIDWKTEGFLNPKKNAATLDTADFWLKVLIRPVPPFFPLFFFFFFFFPSGPVSAQGRICDLFDLEMVFFFLE